MGSGMGKVEGGEGRREEDRRGRGRGARWRTEKGKREMDERR